MNVAGSTPLQSGQSAQPNPIPTLAAPFEPVSKGDAAAERTREDNGETEGLSGDDKKKHKKRGLFGLGKKKTDEKQTATTTQHQQQQQATKPATKEAAPPPPPPPPEKDIFVRKPTSPIQTEHPYMMPSSPGRGRAALSSSPRMSSPAGSQIFERDVQESSTVLMPNSPAIPSHITTENHIPPVLDASSEAITDDHLDPDSVEIITHTGHQPAAVTVTGAPPQMTYESMAASWAEELASFADRGEADGASNYGSLDTTDVRRLSFISFADVVQAEQQHGPAAGSRDSIHLAGLTSLSMNRSPSPIRSPVSSQGPGTSPPTSKSGSVKGLELSPSRKPIGSPTASAHHPVTTGELNIETMSQALRRTGSRDLSGVRSLPISPIDGPSR